MKKTVSIVFALLLVAMLFVSCSGGNDGSADEGTAAPGESAAGDNGEIAVILQTYNGSFWSDVMRGIDTATEELKDEGITVNFNGPDDATNLQAQIEMIEAAVARDVIALAVAPADAAAVGNVMPRCEEKNIPVVTFDVNAESDWPVCLVSSDNYKPVSYTHLLFHSIDISDCPYTNSLDSRLAELDYLLNNDLADVDCENWEEDTPFKDPRELYDFLKTEKPEEELVFSHGDLGDSNIFVKDGKVSGFIDLGRSGRADKWYDIAFCVRSIREDIGEEQYVELFFDLLGIKPDWEKIKYYILLDELF